MSTLRIIQTDDPLLAGRSFPLTANETRIGRDPANEIVIGHEAVSRRHARIARVAEGFLIIDEGSTGGVWVNSQRITQHLLRSGDTVVIGNTTFHFEEPQSYAPTASPSPASPARAGGCAIGCLWMSILLFLATIAGSIYALVRAGYLSP